MKIKQVIFTATGEVRNPKKGEYFMNLLGRIEFMDDGQKFITSREIYTMQEVEWKPKRNESYYTIDLGEPNGVFDTVWIEDDTDNKFYELGLCFPYTEQGHKLAIEKAKQILEFLKEN